VATIVFVASQEEDLVVGIMGCELSWVREACDKEGIEIL
jgi:hypothetical protein